MAEAKRRWSWRSWLPDVSTAVSRFPLAVALAGLLTVYELINNLSADLEGTTVGTLAAGFLWVVAVDLYCESHRLSRIAHGLGWLAGIAAIALLFQFQWQIFLMPLLLIGALLLLVGLSGELGRAERNAAFWLFNHRLWLAAGVAAVGAVLFGIGLSASLQTLNFLFGLGLPPHWREYVGTVALCFLAPVSWLALAPTSFTDRVGLLEETEFTTRAIANLVKFVLVPLLLVYTAILYAYAIKIGIAGELPKGTLGNLVVGYLLVGAATLLLAYPSRESGGVLVRLFWHYWVWLALMPVALLFLAISTRIGAYGITEQRYLIVLIGVWALALAVLRIARRDSLDLRLIPGVLALLLFAASFGPWGAIGASVASQKAELARLLTEKGLLVEGKIVPKPAADNPLGTSAGRVRGLEWYLNTRHALGALAPWFEGHDPDPFAEGKAPEQSSREILAALSLRADVPNSGGVAYFTHYSDIPTVVSLGGGGSHVIGPVVFEGGGPSALPVPAKSVEVEGLGTVRLEIEDNQLTASLADGRRLSFNILDAARELADPLSKDHHPLRLKASDGDLRGVLLIDNLNGSYSEPDFDFSLIRFWMVLEKKG